MSYPHAILIDMVAGTHDSAFVGRAAELEELRGALTRVRAGESATILLGGEAGGGKTRLITEFTRGSQSRVLYGECLELGFDGLPYAPFAAMLRELVRELGVEHARSLVPGGPDELSRLLPGLGEPPPAGEQSRARLYEQLLTLFERVSEEQPLILVVEDAHWAEQSTRDLIVFLARNLTTGRVLLVLSYRSDELHRTHPLRPVLAGLARDRRTTRVEVPAFTRAEVAELATAMLGQEITPQFVDDLYERSSGNPLFVETLVDCGDEGCYELPESLRDLILARIFRLPEATQEVLRTVAGSPGQVGHALLARVSMLDDAGLIDALRPAVAANVLVSSGDGYAFRHALIREAVHDESLPGEHPRLHKRFAEAIEAEPELVPGPRVASELAHHWYAARERDKALVAAWRAAEQARERLAYAEQLRMLERVLDLWDHVPDAETLIGADAVRPLELAADAARVSANYPRAVALATAALRRVDERAERERAALLLEVRAKSLVHQWSDKSIDDLRRAAALLDETVAPAASAMILSSLAQYLWLQPIDPEAKAYAEQALRLARAAGDPASEAHALITYATVIGERPEALAEARADLARASDLARTADRHDLLLRAATNESSILEGAGAHEPAAEVARAGIELAAERGLARSQGTFLTLNLAEPLISLGRWAEADEMLDAALALVPPPDHRFLLLIYKGRLAADRGDAALAREAVRVIQAIVGDRYFRAQERLPQLRLRLALALLDGDPRPALDETLRALSDQRSQRAPRYSWPLVVLSARAIRVLNSGAAPETEPATAAYADLSAIAERLAAGGPVESAHELTWRAEAPLIEGDDPAALAAWAAARQAWATLKRPYEQATALAREVDVALRLGERELAACRLREAVPIAARLGAEPLRRELDELAHRGRLSPSGEPGPAPADHGLTPRERDVLALVAAGRSNRQIAAELFISAKTASVHVSNILGKLGVASRGEAAAAAHRLHLFDHAAGEPYANT